MFFDDIGKKIKDLARAIFFIEIIGGIITGIVLCANGEGLAGFITILCSVPVAWCSSCLLFGFGELIDKVCDIERHVRKEDLASVGEVTAHKESAKEQKQSAPQPKKALYSCAKCGHSGPYIGACPKCGSFKTKRD